MNALEQLAELKAEVEALSEYVDSLARRLLPIRVLNERFSTSENAVGVGGASEISLGIAEVTYKISELRLEIRHLSYDLDLPKLEGE
jgi:hypothetical protein